MKCMQRLPCNQFSLAPVKIIPHQRMADGLAVGSDLMGASGYKSKFKQRIVRVFFQNFIQGQGLLSVRMGLTDNSAVGSKTERQGNLSSG